MPNIPHKMNFEVHAGITLSLTSLGFANRP
jgi:hypothetical protein